MAKDLDLSELRILVAGGNAQGISLLRQVFGFLGVKSLTVAPGGDAAIDQLYAERFAAVFCEEGVVCGNGEGFAHAARCSKGILAPMIPIFLVCGGPRRRDVEAARDLGYTDVIARPVSAATILKKLKAALVHPRPFIAASDFFGPDRRSQVRPAFRGDERRIRQPRKVRVAAVEGAES